MCACDVDVYSDVFMSRKSYSYKCVQSVKQDLRRSSVFSIKRMLDRLPNLNDVDNTNISNSEQKNKMTRITQGLLIMKVTKRFVLLYYTGIAHTIYINFHDRTVDHTFLFISLVSFKIINS